MTRQQRNAQIERGQKEGRTSFGSPVVPLFASATAGLEHEIARDAAANAPQDRDHPYASVPPVPWESTPSNQGNITSSSHPPAFPHYVPLPSAKSDQTNELNVSATQSRVRVRHSFDVFADQPLTLREIVLTREEQSGQRVRLGDLVQEALDRLIADEYAGTPIHEATGQSRDQQAHQERAAGRNAEDATAAGAPAVSAVSPVLVPTAGPRGDQREQKGM